MEKDKKIAKSPNKSQTSISPSNGYKDKFQKIGKFYGMKNSFTGANDHEKKKDFQFHAPTTPEIKPEHRKQKNKEKQKEEREYLNVFEDDDL